MANRDGRIAEAIAVLKDLGLPRAQQNQRSAVCLLALLNLAPNKDWRDCEAPLVGITPIMEWSRRHYKTTYAPNTRETFRRQTMHQFVSGGIALYNADRPDRPVNSPHAVYQIEPSLLDVLRSYGTAQYARKLAKFQAARLTLSARYAKERSMRLVPVRIGAGAEIKLSAGKHSELIRDIIEQFGPRFVPGAKVVYVGDTGDKWGYFDRALLTKLGVKIDNHGKMPDVVLYFPDRKWLLLIESVTSHGPVDPKRHEELSELFQASRAGLVFVSAFPNRQILNKYLQNISWESEVWVADAPSHLIHFNGVRFLGPYED